MAADRHKNDFNASGTTVPPSQKQWNEMQGVRHAGIPSLAAASGYGPEAAACLSSATQSTGSQPRTPKSQHAYLILVLTIILVLTM
jgi:hypothetical protein